MGKPVTPLKTYINLQDPEMLKKIRKELRGKSVVYIFHLNDSTDSYVGQTIEPEARFFNHLYSGRDSNLHLQNSFKKHGLKNFTLYIVEIVELSDKKQVETILTKLEQNYMDLLEPSYNFSRFAGKSRKGVLHSEASKKLMSEAMLGKNVGKVPVNKGTKLTQEQKNQLIMASQHRYKPVYFYDEANNLVSMFSSLNAASKAEKANKNHLINCIKTGKLFRGWLITYWAIK